MKRHYANIKNYMLILIKNSSYWRRVILPGIAITSMCFGQALGWYFTSADASNLHSKPADFVLFYGKGALQYGELRLPSSKNSHPVVIIIHGGCWTSSYSTLKSTAAFADAIRDLGLATWNIEYRRIGDTGGGWPGTFNDIADATDFLATISKKYSLDLSNVIVIGHSAGGHLAMWVAARHNIPKNNPLYNPQYVNVKAVISLGGVPDLQAFWQQSKVVCNVGTLEKLTGYNLSKTARRSEVTSPINLLPSRVLEFLFYGDEDEIVPSWLAQDYIRKSLAKGDNVQLFIVKGAAHHDYIVPNSIVWPKIIQTICYILSKENGSSPEAEHLIMPSACLH